MPQAFTPLSQDQFDGLLAQGLEVDDIIRLEQERKTKLSAPQLAAKAKTPEPQGFGERLKSGFDFISGKTAREGAAAMKATDTPEEAERRRAFENVEATLKGAGAGALTSGLGGAGLLGKALSSGLGAATTTPQNQGGMGAASAVDAMFGLAGKPNPGVLATALRGAATGAGYAAGQGNLENSGTSVAAAGAIPALVQGVLKGAGKTKLPEFLMNSAIKPQQRLTEEKADAAIKLMLDKGITATKNGRQVYGAMQDKLEGQVNDKLAKAGDAGTLIDQGKIYQKAIGEARRRVKGAAGSQESLDKINAVAKQFRDENSTPPTPADFQFIDGKLTKVGGSPRVWDQKTPLEINDQKKKTYALHKRKYVGPESSGDVNEATAMTAKGIAHKQMKALEKADPTIKEINTEIGTLNDVKRAVKQVKANERRQQLFSLPNMVAATTGLTTGLATGYERGDALEGALAGLGAGAGIRYLDRSGPKSRLAVLLAEKLRRDRPKNLTPAALFNLLPNTGSPAE